MIVSSQRAPSLIIKEQSQQDVSLTVYSSADSALTVEDGTYTLYNAAGVIVTTGAISVNGATASYTLTASDTVNQTLGSGWREVWALSLSDGSIPVFTRPAILASIPLYATITPDDLLATNVSLSQVATYTIDGVETTWNTYAWTKLDSCWSEVIRSLTQMGRLPDRVVSLDLFDMLRALTLWRIFRDLRTTEGDLYDLEARAWEAEVTRIKAGAILSYDLDGDGVIDTSVRGVGGSPIAQISSGWPWGIL